MGIFQFGRARLATCYMSAFFHVSSSTVGERFGPNISGQTELMCLNWRNIPITLRTPFFRFAFQLHQGKPIARTPRSYRSVTLTPDFWPSSGIVSINDFVGFVFRFFMPPHSLPLRTIRSVSRSSTGSLQSPSPVYERWHLASAMTESVPV